MSLYLKCLIAWSVITLCVFAFASCDTKSKQTPIDTSNCLDSSETIEVRVHIYDNDRQVTQAYKEHIARYNIDADQSFRSSVATREGFAWWFEDEPYYCDVHVTKLRFQEDPRMVTWGHEFAHCVCRSFHEEGQY